MDKSRTVEAHCLLIILAAFKNLLDIWVSLVNLTLHQLKGFMFLIKKSWATATVVFFLTFDFSAQCQLCIVSGLEPQRIFSGSGADVFAIFSNPTGQNCNLEIHTRLVQTSSSTAVFLAEKKWKQFEILAGQIVQEKTEVNFPTVNAETRFLVQWLDETNRVIGKTSRVYGETVQGSSTVSIVDLSSNLATKIVEVISKKGDTLVAKVETHEERVAKIKQAIAGKKLPVVAVKVSERHYGPHIIDPAAESELSLILQQCGFKLADGGSNEKADIEISGDAFSAYGMQKGNLISCKSRVEVKVREVATGNILFTDRQTSVGVDVAEQTAAKTALQNAADTLAERILPQLTK